MILVSVGVDHELPPSLLREISILPIIDRTVINSSVLLRATILGSINGIIEAILLDLFQVTPLSSDM
ncbi:hypothetical protein D3C80_1116090 [compost metagenome]